MAPETSELVSKYLDGNRSARDDIDVALDRAIARKDQTAVAAILDPIAHTAAAGSSEALSTLLALIDGHRLALGPVRKILSDPGDVEDALQDVLITVNRRIATFEGRSRFSSWLYVVAQNAAKQVLRKRSRQAIPAEQQHLDIDPGLRRMSSIISSRDAVDQAIARLPEEFRAVIVLREMENHTYDEIAELLGIELGTVKSRLRRARERVATDLSDL